MRKEQFFKHDLMDFVELRHSEESPLSFKPHLHKNLSVGAIEQGEVLYEVAGQKQVLRPGGLAIINPETLHSCNPTSSAARSYFMLYLDVDWCFKVQQALWDINSFVRTSKVHLNDQELYQRFCSSMYLLMNPTIHLQEKEQLLFDLLCDVFEAACIPQPAQIENDEGIETLKTILSDNLEDDLPLNELAQELGYNPYTMIRCFKARTGITPHAYRMNCRIDRAKSYLREGKDIAETALECGFFDQSHFHRHFKAMTTVTPQEYRVNFIQ